MALVMLLGVALPALVGVPAEATVVCPESGSTSGVDVSRFQGSVDWPQVAAAGKSFGFARAFDGWVDDPLFVQHFTGMKAAGMRAGAYLRFRPSVDPADQARALLAQLGRAGFAPGDLVPVVDVESTDGVSGATLLARLQVAVDLLTAALGTPPVIYTAPAWWRSNVSPTDGPAGTPLWVANYGVACPDVPAPWSTWSVWQYGIASSLPGVSGPIDLDQSNGDSLVGAAAHPVAFIGATTAPAGHLGKPYDVAFTTAGVPRPSVVVAEGSLPPGLGLDPVTGRLSGTPTQAGSFTFRLRAFNSSGGDAVTSPLTVEVSTWQADHGFHPLPPSRILETRTAFGSLQYPTPWGPGTDRPVQVVGVGGVPAGATAVALNVTAVNPSTATDLRVYPNPSHRPNASNLNAAAGQTTPNLVVVPVGAGGTVRLFNSAGTVDVVADVAGWFGDTVSDGDLYHPLLPARVVETRQAYGWMQYPTPWGPGAARSVRVTGVGGVPADATAVVLNVTGVAPTVPTDLRLYPSGRPVPNASNLNLVPGQAAPNLVVVPVGDGGAVDLANSAGTVDVVVDVAGYFAADTGVGFHGLEPQRILETRPVYGSLQYPTPWGPGTDRSVQVAGLAGVPLGATAVVLNVTAVTASAATHLQVYPAGSTPLSTSNLNVRPGETRANLVVAPLGTDGKVRIANSSGRVDLVADVAGYFS